MAGRKVTSSVYVGDRWWRPGDTMPDDLAEKVTNPKVFAAKDGSEPADQPQAEPGAPTGARLARRVNVGGTWYGPDDHVPEDVAALITNPKAWKDGEVPTKAPAPAAAASTGDGSGGGGNGAGGPDTGSDKEPAGGPADQVDEAGEDAGDEPAEAESPEPARPRRVRRA